MAGDWIKMRTDLYRDPKVCVIADRLMRSDSDLARYTSNVCMRDMTVTRNVMRNVTVGALVTLWGVTRHRGKRVGDDLLVKNASLEVCDDIAELPGLGDALAFVGWVIETEDGIIFPRFFAEFNVDPSLENKEKNAERQRKYREKRNALRDVTCNVTVTSQSNAREEREKEEEKSNKHTHPHARERSKIESQNSKPPEGLEADWQRWMDYRESIDGRPIDAIRADAMLMDLGRRGIEKAKRDIEFSILKGAKSILDSDHDFSARAAPAASQGPRNGNSKAGKKSFKEILEESRVIAEAASSGST